MSIPSSTLSSITSPSLGPLNPNPVAERHRAALLVRGQHRAADSSLARDASLAAKPDATPLASRTAAPVR